jgi:adenylylsulfate kinase-like enzyme
MVIWIIGLAGSGKTTIGTELVARLRDRGRPVVHLDGDTVRAALGHDLGHTIDDRRINGRRIAGLCGLLEAQGIDVVAGVLAIDPVQLVRNRETFASYVEIELDVSWATLEARDQKGLYSGARAGRVRDVVGVDIPFARPASPDLVIGETDSIEALGRQVDRIVELALGRAAA